MLNRNGLVRKKGFFFNIKDKATCNLIFLNLQTVGSIKSSNRAESGLLIETERGNVRELIGSNKAAGFVSIFADGIAMIDEMTELGNRTGNSMYSQLVLAPRLYNCIKLEKPARKAS